MNRGWGVEAEEEENMHVQGCCNSHSIHSTNSMHSMGIVERDHKPRGPKSAQGTTQKQPEGVEEEVIRHSTPAVVGGGPGPLGAC